MEKMLVAVFATESKAYEGSRALARADGDGSITIHAQAVIKKNPDNTVTIKEVNEAFPIVSLTGTAVGSLIGLLEGPAGFALGADTGMFAGMVRDLFVAGVDAQFVHDAGVLLTPGKCAVVADISEEWESPVDTKMADLGATVVRVRKQVVEQDHRAREAAVLREQIDQLKAEYAKVRVDPQAKLKARIDKLEADLQRTLNEVQQRSAQMKQEAAAKIQALKKKAEDAPGELKTTLDARVTRIRQDFDASQAKVKHLLANSLTTAAARLEK